MKRLEQLFPGDDWITRKQRTGIQSLLGLCCMDAGSEVYSIFLSDDEEARRRRNPLLGGSLTLHTVCLC